MGRGKGVPVALLERVTVDQFVEQTLGVIVFPQTKECAGHQLLEVIGILLTGAHHPLHGLVVDAIVGVDVGHVKHVVLIFVGRDILQLLTQERVGLVDLVLGQENLCMAVDILRRLTLHHAVQILLGCFDVAGMQRFVNLVVQYRQRVRIGLHGTIDSSLRFVVALFRQVVFSDVNQVVGVHQRRLTRLG